MKRNFKDENLEQFLRQNSDSLRMRPSARVWRGIATELNKRRRRGFIFGALFLSLGVFGYFIGDQSYTKQHSFVSFKHSENNTAFGIEPKTVISALKSFPTNIYFKRPEVKKFTSNINYNRLHVSRLFPTQNVLEESNQPQISESGNDFKIESDNLTPDLINKSAEKWTNKSISQSDNSIKYPLTIESILNTYKRKRSKFSSEIYFTPTISYRKLGDNKSYLRSVTGNTIPYNYPRLYNINAVVTQKPNFGLEFGWAAKYKLSNIVKLKGGFQFNVNRYDIKAFNSSTQLATIQLNSRNNADSLNTVTNYSNLNGYETNWLQNFYFEISAPIGVEIKLRGDDKVQFGIASTVQPTYILGDRAYLLTTDYKQYTQVPWLTRRWNVNTSFETYVSYSTGHLNWHVGPQIRYQLLSSFINKYPVKENLYDFGLRVGISVNK